MNNGFEKLTQLEKKQNLGWKIRTNEKETEVDKIYPLGKFEETNEIQNNTKAIEPKKRTRSHPSRIKLNNLNLDSRQFHFKLQQYTWVREMKNYLKKY